MSSQAFVIVPPPGMAVILQDQVLCPGTVNQTPTSIQNGNTTLQTMYPANQFPGGTGPAGKPGVLRGSPKVLGAIQILIGTVHLTFGSLLLMFSEFYTPYIMLLGYLYWGGILFIVSGTFLTLAERYKVSCMLKTSLVLNIISSLAAAIGVFIFLVDILYFPGDQYRQHAVDWKMAQGLSNMILFFTILEVFTGIVASLSCYYALNQQGDEAACLMTNEEIKQ